MSAASGMSGDEQARNRRIWPYVLPAVLFGIAAMMLWAWLALLAAADQEGCRRSVNSVFVLRSFPPQGWCVEGSVATASISPRDGLTLIALLTATLLCASVAVTIKTPAAWITSVLIVAAGAIGAVMAAQDEPTPAAVQAAGADAAEDARERAPRPDRPSPGPTPTPADVREQLELLAADALSAVPPGTLWRGRPTVISSPCEDGQVLSLTGRFTARDFGTARDEVDFNRILHANEDAAAAIVEAWNAPSGSDGTLKRGVLLHRRRPSVPQRPPRLGRGRRRDRGHQRLDPLMMS